MKTSIKCIGSLIAETSNSVLIFACLESPPFIHSLEV